MGAVQAISTITSASMSLYQSQQEAALRKAQAELDANTLEAQAARKDLEADEALAVGRLNVAEQQAQGRVELAEKRAEYGASGVKVNEGSAVTVLADRAAWNEYERQKLEYEAALQSWGLKYDAEMLRQQAKNTRAAGVSSTVSTLANVSGTTSSLANQILTIKF